MVLHGGIGRQDGSLILRQGIPAVEAAGVAGLKSQNVVVRLHVLPLEHIGQVCRVEGHICAQLQRLVVDHATGAVAQVSAEVELLSPAVHGCHHVVVIGGHVVHGRAGTFGGLDQGALLQERIAEIEVVEDATNSPLVVLNSGDAIQPWINNTRYYVDAMDNPTDNTPTLVLQRVYQSASDSWARFCSNAGVR